MVASYKALPGYFLQDTPSNDIPVTVPPRFGLLDEWSWSSLKENITQLNTDSPDNVSYKLFLLGRHGEGYHNVAEAKYGTQAWDDYWSKLNGDGEIVWGPDAELTPLGISQAQAAHNMWVSESQDIQPGIFLSSPMTRAMHTVVLSFEGIELDHELTVWVLENCREEYGVHTCDKRHTKSEIAARYPEHFTFEDDFSEQDTLWEADFRETKKHTQERAKDVLDRVFGGEWGNSSYVSITAHGGIINAFLVNTGRETYSLPTGGVLPVVIECTKTA